MRCHIVFALLFVCIGSVGFVAAEDYLFDNPPRRDLHGPIPSTFCAYTPETGCQAQKYAEFVGLLLVPGIVVGLFLVIALLAFCCCYTCCSSSSYHGSQKNILILKMLIIIINVAIVVLLIPAFIGNSRASSGMKDFSNETVSFVEEIQALSEHAQEILNQINITSEIDLSETVDSTRQLVEKGRDIQKQYTKYEDIRAQVFIATYVVLIVMCLVGIVSCFIWLCCSGHINFCCGLAMIVFMWLVFSIALALGTVTTDSCKIFDQQREFESQNSTNTIIDIYLGPWGANCSAFGQVFDTSFDAVDSLLLQFCSEYNQTCFKGYIQPNQYCSSCGPEDDPETVIDQTQVFNAINCPSPNCPVGFCNGGNDGVVCKTEVLTVEQCSETCEIEEAKTSAGEILKIAQDLSTLKDLIDLVRPYTGYFLSGLEMMVIASGMIGCILAGFCIAMLLSIKRLNPSRWLPNEEESEDVARYSTDYSPEGGKSVHQKGTFTGTIGFWNARTFVVEPGHKDAPQEKPRSLNRVGSLVNIKSYSSQSKYNLSSPLDDLGGHGANGEEKGKKKKPSAASVFQQDESPPSYNASTGSPPPVNPEYSDSS